MLFRYELKKLILTPAVTGFTVLCLALNIVLVAAYSPGVYLAERSEPEDVFQGYDTLALADYYIGKYQVSEKNAEHIRAKYTRLQPVVNEKSSNGDALSPYFREETRTMHELLFVIVLKAVIAEVCVAALFLGLLAANYETIHGTEHIVCSSKKGRRVILTRLAAALTATLAVFAVLTGVTLAAYFLRFDYSAVWGSNVSSAFNMTPDEYGKPFITWHSFTVSGYLLAMIGAEAGLALCFAFLGFAVGTFLRHGYGSAVAAIALCFAMYVTEPLLPVGSRVRNAFTLSPVYLWVRCHRWFTDGNADIIIPHFETAGILGSLAVLSLLTAAAYRLYQRRDIL